MTLLLDIKNVSIALPRHAGRSFAVENATFSVRRGEIVCVVGESGSGKSALASAIIGLLPSGLRFAAGVIDFAGLELARLKPSAFRGIRGLRIASIMQEPAGALNPLLTIGRQIEDVLSAHGHGGKHDERMTHVHSILAAMHLPDPVAIANRYPHQLSGGQRQRATIAKALVLKPELLIADEPTTALDVSTQAQILSLILEMRAKLKLSVLFVTHDIGVVQDIADSVIVMNRGRIVEKGPARSVLGSPANDYTRRLISAVPKFETVVRPSIVDNPILTVQGLTKTYGELGNRKALDDVSFVLHRGETLAVVGESGSGKSTLAGCIVGTTNPDEGSIRFEGHDLARLNRRDFRMLRKRVQMIFQDPGESLNPLRKVGDIITRGPVSLGMNKKDAEQKTRALLRQVGFGDGAYDRRPSSFSGGERQRIAIVRALVHRPLLLIADEPVSALDVTVQASILDLLDTLRVEYQITMIFITHDLRVAARMADKVLILRNGREIESGPVDRVLKRPSHPYSQALVQAVPGTRFPALGMPYS